MVLSAGSEAQAWAAPGQAAVQARDADGDGIADGADRCPARAGLPPDGCPPIDSDGDQVLDSEDRCPALAGPLANQGCPDGDRDHDGVVDRRDRCPEQYGLPESDGCWPTDRDGDAIADASDRCPDEPEVWNDHRDRDGCPDRGQPLLQVADGRIRFPRPTRLGRDDRSLSLRWRREIALAAVVLRAARARKVRLAVVAEYGLSYGDSLQRARRRAQAVRKALLKATDFAPAQIEVACPGPDGKPRIEIVYRLAGSATARERADRADAVPGDADHATAAE